jgi:hypothetical protein
MRSKVVSGLGGESIRTRRSTRDGSSAVNAAIYSVNWENPDTDYETGDILNLDGSITKNFGPLGLGVVSYAVIQTTRRQRRRRASRVVRIARL